MLSKGPMMSAQKVYRQIINEDDGGPRHVINTPRDHNQVKNFQKENNRQFRISHDALYNAYQLCFQLQFKDRRGEPQDFLRHFQIFPTITIHLMPQPLLGNLEMLLKVSTTCTMTLFLTWGIFIYLHLFFDMHYLKAIRLLQLHISFIQGDISKITCNLCSF